MTTSTQDPIIAGPAPNNVPMAQILERLFGHTTYSYDLYAGTVHSSSDVRVLYLNEDLINGIYDTLMFETGEAWKIILKNCGYIWGKRVATALTKELSQIFNITMEQLPVAEYLQLLEGYFAKHGWGKVTVHLQDAEQYGIIRVSLTNSLFAMTLKRVGGKVDYLMAGMLRGLFEQISGHVLDCVQICDERSPEQHTSEFLVSSIERIKVIEPSTEQALGFDSAIQQLRAA